MDVGIVILAAGNGARFGGNKLLAPLAGQPVVGHVLALVPARLCARTRLVTQYQALFALGAAHGIPVIRNDRPELGQSHSVRLGVQALADTDGILFLAGDQPWVRKQTVTTLLELFAQHPERIVGAKVGERLRNPCVFPRSLYPELLSLEGDTGGRPVLMAHRALWLGLETDPAELRDIDRREDLPDTEAGRSTQHATNLEG